MRLLLLILLRLRTAAFGRRLRLRGVLADEAGDKALFERVAHTVLLSFWPRSLLSACCASCTDCTRR